MTMSRPQMRSAIGCAVACGAMVGSALAGAAVANANPLGVGPDINVLGVDVLGSGNSSSRSAATARNASLPAVSTAPSARGVVIRAKVPSAQAEPKLVPADFSVPMADAPVESGPPMAQALSVAPLPAAPAAVPLSVPRPIPAAPPVLVPSRPRAVPVPSTIEPGPGRQYAPADSYPSPAEIPASFRVGYAEYLRAATTTDLFVAAMPGVAGIAGFTMLGAFAGYRQARAVQAALLAPVPTRILL